MLVPPCGGGHKGTVPIAIDPPLSDPPRVPGRLPARKISLFPLVAATYFMVAGGPYGLEDLVGAVGGYGVAVLVLLGTPLLWSLPTALMVSELSSALPEEGGYYVWVRRALGPFWGFQEAWLSLAASVFDLAIYPALFVRYLAGLLGRPDLTGGGPAWVLGAGVIAVCAGVNLRGARTVGGSSLGLILLLLGPFVVLCVGALFRPPVPTTTATPAGAAAARFDVLAGVLVAMWNFMGWDNAATVAGEVEQPQRTYPRAMFIALALVVGTYVLPVLAASRAGLEPARWTAGAWVEVGTRVAGPGLGVAIAVGGMVGALGTFNSLVLSYSRLPVALAADGFLPAAFARRHPRTGAPVLAIVTLSAAWALALGLSLPRLFALDVILYGLSLLLEFAALVTLRRREPGLARPFRVPGGDASAWLLGVGPAALVGLAVFDQARRWTPEEGETLAPGWGLVLGAALAGLGPVVYRWGRRRHRGGERAGPVAGEEAG